MFTTWKDRLPGARRRYLSLGIVVIVVALAIVSLLIPEVRGRVRAVMRPEPPARITPLALVAPPTARAATPTPEMPATPTATRLAPVATVALGAAIPVATSTPSATPVPATPTASAAPTATAGPVVVAGRTYDAYIPAATKASQAYQYSCEFDAAWVVLETYGFAVSVDELIGVVGVDRSVEPYLEETPQGFVIHGGDILTAFSGDYTKNFLARSSGAAMRKAFEHYGLSTSLVGNRGDVEAALRSGALVWIKTTVDFKPWRAAVWRLPDGSTYRTVVGNDHAVVVIGFNERGVVIRDVLGPTSTNRQRPYEYEVDWTTFLTVWEAQSFDGLAVAPPRDQQ